MGRREREPEYVELEGCYVHRVTEKAIQITHDGTMVWVPKSVIEDPEGYERWEADATILVEEWFARKAELI